MFLRTFAVLILLTLSLAGCTEPVADLAPVIPPLSPALAAPTARPRFEIPVGELTL
jgi:hypothetical protein